MKKIFEIFMKKLTMKKHYRPKAAKWNVKFRYVCQHELTGEQCDCGPEKRTLLLTPKASQAGDK